MELRFITPSRPIDCPVITREFTAKEGASGTLLITGLGLYRACLNGERVGDDWFAPGFNDYDAYLRCGEYDVTQFLRAGKNTLEVYLGQGQYMGRFGLEHGSDTCIYGSRFLLGARLALTSPDGSTCAIETDESWLASESCIVTGNLYDGEVRDDTRVPGDRVPCVPCDAPAPLVMPMSPPIRVKCELKPELIITPKGEKVLDFKQNFAGVFRFRDRSAKGERVHFRTGEVLQEGCFYNANLRSARSEYTYISSGRGETVEPVFTFFGYRYLCVECSYDIDPADFTGLVLSSDLRETLRAETDNPLLNRLMLNSLWGQRSNFLDVPTDCPQRDERLGWTADTQVFVNTACYQMDCRDFYAKFMRDLREDQLRWGEGDLPKYSPCLKGQGAHGGAVWSDAGTLVPWYIWQNYGDRALLAESYPMMRDYCEYLIRQDEALGGTRWHLTQFTFGDWLARDGVCAQAVKGGTDDDYIRAVYYYLSIHLTAEAAAVLGNDADAARYGKLAEEIRQAVLDEFFTPSGRLCVDTQTGYVLALRFGIYRTEAPVALGLRKRMRRDGYRVTTGFTGTPFLLQVLFDHGMEDLAYHLLLNEQYPGWLACIKLGATTIWERWNSLDENGRITGISMNSLNHYAYGSVCESIYSRICGLGNAAPGWRKAVVAPHINGRLKHSAISFDSPAGLWQVRWDILSGNRISLEVTVPESAECEIIPDGHPDGKRLTVSGGTWREEWISTKDLASPRLYPVTEQELLESRPAKDEE